MYRLEYVLRWLSGQTCRRWLQVALTAQRGRGGRGKGEVKIAAAAALWVRCAGPQTSFHLSRTPVRPCKTLTDQRPLLDANVQLFFSASVHLLHARLRDAPPQKNGIFLEFFPKGGGATVGQDVDELICQSERKMQQNATFYL